MKQVGVRAVRHGLTALLEAVRRGDEFTVTQHGRPVAKLVPIRESPAKPFRGYHHLWNKFKLRGEPLSRTVERMRREARY